MNKNLVPTRTPTGLVEKIEESRALGERKCPCKQSPQYVPVRASVAEHDCVVAAAGAIATVLPSPGKADDQQPLRGPYKIEDWGKTWLNPNKDRVLARVPAIALPDIAGYWPQTTRPVRGPQGYAKRIIDLLDFIPDFRAEPIERASDGHALFPH